MANDSEITRGIAQDAAKKAVTIVSIDMRTAKHARSARRMNNCGSRPMPPDLISRGTMVNTTTHIIESVCGLLTFGTCWTFGAVDVIHGRPHRGLVLWVIAFASLAVSILAILLW